MAEAGVEAGAEAEAEAEAGLRLGLGSGFLLTTIEARSSPPQHHGSVSGNGRAGALFHPASQPRHELSSHRAYNKHDRALPIEPPGQTTTTLRLRATPYFCLPYLPALRTAPCASPCRSPLFISPSPIHEPYTNPSLSLTSQSNSFHKVPSPSS